MKLTESFIMDIRRLITSARATVARGVDLVQVHTSFDLGQRIIEQEPKGEQRAAYGKERLKEVSVRLTAEFGRDFSVSNLQFMRQFYLEYRPRIQQTVSGEFAVAPQRLKPFDRPRSAIIRQMPSGKSGTPFTLSWSHYILLLTIQDPGERSFYEIEATSENWSLRELKRQKASALKRSSWSGARRRAVNSRNHGLGRGVRRAADGGVGGSGDEGRKRGSVGKAKGFALNMSAATPSRFDLLTL